MRVPVWLWLLLPGASDARVMGFGDTPGLGGGDMLVRRFDDRRVQR